MNDLNKLVTLIEIWAEDKGLDEGDGYRQFAKTVEETGEIASALCRGDKDKLKDGIGDVVVTLVILALQKGLSLEECVEMAWNEIKGRTGEMKDGVFVKSEDL